jgi:hypothetical protein
LWQRILLFFAALLFLSRLLGHSQQSTPITLNVNAGNLLATVRDNHGDIVRNLTKMISRWHRTASPRRLLILRRNRTSP